MVTIKYGALNKRGYMKISSKILTIVLGSVAAVGTIAGGVMLGVGGNHTTTIDTSIIPGGSGTISIGTGMLNYVADKAGFNGGKSFDEYLKEQEKVVKDAPEQIKGLEAIPGQEATVKTLKTQLENAQAVLSMHALAIAGAVFLALGLATGVITGAMVFINRRKSK